MKDEPKSIRELKTARYDEKAKLMDIHNFVTTELLSVYELENNNDRFWNAKIEFSQALSNLIQEYRRILE